jgi:hypothetical protein
MLTEQSMMDVEELKKEAIISWPAKRTSSVSCPPATG